MTGIEKLKVEYEEALAKKRQFQEKLRDVELKDPSNLSEIWRNRDQIAYWSGRAEGLMTALEALEQ